jgi:hypothetical protein
MINLHTVYLTIISVTIILDASMLVTLLDIGNSGIAQGQGKQGSNV